MKSIDAQSCRALKSRGSRTSRRIVIRTSTNGLPNQEAFPRILFCAQGNTPIFICDSPEGAIGGESAGDQCAALARNAVDGELHAILADGCPDLIDRVVFVHDHEIASDGLRNEFRPARDIY